jgi:uncharacterized protein (DUF58 family)
MRRLIALLALAALLLGLGAAEGWSLLYTLAYALLFILGVAWLWTWGGLRSVYVRPRPARIRTQVGQLLEDRFEVENTGWLPKPWLEILDGSDYPQHNLSRVLSLGPLDRRAYTVRTRCRQRGAFTLGPTWVATGDPFGLFHRQRQASGACDLVVFPATVELASFGQLPGELPGGPVRGERVHFTTSNVATVREYAPGDSFNRVHWPTTARQGRVMVKEFERDPFSDVWLVLDLDRLIQVGSGADSTEEWAVTIAASLGRYFLLHERALGLLTQGQGLPLDRGPRQLLKLLEFLAVVRPRSRQSLDELLLAQAQRLGRRDTLVIITPSADLHWVTVCRDLAQRGVRSSVALIEPASFGPAPSSARLLTALGEAGLPTYHLRHGDDLALALARPLVGRA